MGATEMHREKYVFRMHCRSSYAGPYGEFLDIGWRNPSAQIGVRTFEVNLKRRKQLTMLQVHANQASSMFGVHVTPSYWYHD